MGSIVKSIGGILGGHGGGGMQPVERANILAPITQDQAKQQFQNTQDALAQQNQFAQALQGQNGIQNQSNVYNQLQQQALGQGPNPAQAMLANQTGANAAQQAALMAGQRGSSSNAGLIARQAAQQGAAMQQQAAGQGAALQAQQSANAIGQAGNMAGQMVSNQGNAISNQNQFAQNNMNALANQNQAALGQAGQINQFNAAQNKQTAEQQGNMIGALTGAAGTALAGPLGGALAGMFTSKTPEVAKAEGGEIKRPISLVDHHINHFKMAKGGVVPALVSPGEIYLKPEQVSKVKQGANPMKVGEKIPGKPKVGGAKDSYQNDFVKKDLKEGGIVLPRSVTKSDNPNKHADAFIHAIISRKKHSR